MRASEAAFVLASVVILGAMVVVAVHESESSRRDLRACRDSLALCQADTTRTFSLVAPDSVFYSIQRVDRVVVLP